MSNKASLLFLVALAIGANASPAPAPVVGREITVALRNRANLTTSDGVFDKDKILHATDRTINKHRQNLLNLKNNKGADALPEGANLDPRQYTPGWKRQAEPLTDQVDGREWTGTVSVGTPGQQFLIDFDTGSADLWVPSSTCKSYACGFKSTYKASNSVTSVKKSETFLIKYEDGTEVSGPTYTDAVTIAGIQVTKQWFSAVTTMSDNYATDPADGVLGLAFPAVSELNQSPWFTTAYTEKKLKKNQFGFFLGTSGSELYLGGTHAAKYIGGLEFHSIDPKYGYWLVPGASAKVGSTTAVSGFETIIDSGTTLMYGPPAEVAKLYAKIPGGGPFLPEYGTLNGVLRLGGDLDIAPGLYQYTCNPEPKISFNWGGKDWVVSSAYFNLGLTAKGSTKCVGALIGETIIGNNIWLLGDAFMQNVYTAFDFDKEAVGFAALA
ncbi:Acid protease [Mycena sanguinolenta]|uniref:Acid protease n=1 Tax=Mycena sanguinolenta TaxID=230812 RepID=A0A8H7CMM2_9AGAR|nr:Acid protease [Mycena sanguinolenta]